ncbi:hypothetical protein BCR32DRAFT_266841 [Anaeromyces robustus]|jgi:hypothetical protein|uniref:Zincin n=1 Tax=Anaeromyces robustus TaxID=1754192 RepID=A0A1Y1XD20_9FUNG|nr:hypothetical protein BCR32DRAFT_266841 [Anaeromyces robustus]|eukprot:ORX83617.1 hypothetical protein BCR32DRAFT_266841 [Anaeromyces robustus]
MKLCSKLLLLINLLAVNSHFVKRSYKSNNIIEVYKQKVPTSLEEVAKDIVAVENGKSVTRLQRVEIEVEEESMFKIDKGKYLKTPLEDPFTLQVHCKSELDCADYPNRVQQAAQYVADTFEFYEVVNVNVTIFPFCDYIDRSMCQSIMGITYPPTFVPLKETVDSDVYLYPQALVKQLSIDQQIAYDETDFIIYLNSNYQPDEAHDNRALIAAHEILHGLGFFHQINPLSVYVSSFESYFTTDFAMPPLNYIEGDDFIKYDGWTPFSIFDKFIVETTNPDNYLHKKLEKFREHDVNIELNTHYTTNQEIHNFIGTFREMENDPECMAGGTEVANLFTTLHAVSFRTKDNVVIELQTFDGTYESASSISHINVPFDCKNSGSCLVGSHKPGVDYLMYFTVISKASTDTLIEAFKDYSPHPLIGPNIVKIMTTLGWNEKSEKKSSSNSNEDTKFSVANGSYNQNSAGSHITSPSCLIIILSFLFLCIARII